MSKFDLDESIKAMETDTLFTHISALEGGDYEHLFQYMKQIAALLKAGQALAEACGEVLACPGQENLGPALCETLLDAHTAYHAALGESK